MVIANFNSLQKHFHIGYHTSRLIVKFLSEEPSNASAPSLFHFSIASNRIMVINSYTYLLGGFSEEDTDAKVHKRHRVVDRLLPLERDREVCNCYISSLK